MSMALDTLFFGIERAGAASRFAQGRTLFLNAQAHAGCTSFLHADVVCYQPLKHHADMLARAGFSVTSDIHSIDGDFDCVLIVLPKSQVESAFLIAHALTRLKAEGVLICAADNKAGGARLVKTLKSFGVHQIESHSKHKARVCVAARAGAADPVIAKAIQAGAMQRVLDGAFTSQPGIFGWDKVDVGSQLLIDHLPATLSGVGADFGCGYGYLSHHAFAHCDGITHMSLIDTDARAIDAARQNMGVRVSACQFIWGDISSDFALPTPPAPLDFILMNPPFHEGKAQDIDLGRGFIEAAAANLRMGGSLYMVANAHLPYEAVLDTDFSTVGRVCEARGFKVFHATR